MKKSILAMLFVTAHAFRMSEDAPAQATLEGVEPAPTTDTPATTVAVEVPAEHESTIQRVLALLERGEQWVVDNVHAGLTTLENMFKGDEDNQ